MHAFARRSSSSFLATFIALLTLSLAATNARAQSPGAVAGMGPVAAEEKSMWDGLQSGNWDAVAAYMAPNFVYVSDQMGNREQSIAGMKTCKLNSYTLHDPQTRALSKDIVLVTYVATVDSVCGPQVYKGDVNCSSLWQRENGKWMGVSHTEAMAARH